MNWIAPPTPACVACLLNMLSMIQLFTLPPLPPLYITTLIHLTLAWAMDGGVMSGFGRPSKRQS